MKAAWVNNLSGSYGTIANTAIWDKATKYGVTRLYFDPRDAQVTNSTMNYVHGKGLQFGFYLVPGWYGSPTPTQFAKTASDYLTSLQANSSQCAVMFDIETHDAAWISAWASAWRTLRPTRATADTFEPFQGGLEPTAVLEAKAIQEAPQEFEGNMSPVVDGAAVVINLVENGSDAANIHPVLDGARITPTMVWDGTAFTFERLP